MFNQSIEDELSQANSRKRTRIVTISMTLWLSEVPVHTRLPTRTSDSKCSEVCRECPDDFFDLVCEIR